MKTFVKVLSTILVLMLLPCFALADLKEDAEKAMERRGQQDIKTLLEECHHPFHGELLNTDAYGTPELLAHNYNIGRNVPYSAWLFYHEDAKVVAEIVKVNQEEYYFSHFQETYDGITFDVLAQFGQSTAGGITYDEYSFMGIASQEVWIGPFSGGTLLLIENGMTVSGLPSIIPTQYIRCNTCNGTGECQSSYCDYGKCITCKGTGKKDCSNCTNGNCRACKGRGTYTLASGTPYTCGVCKGIGDCRLCSGTGWQNNTKCTQCSTTGKCTSCHGSNHCQTCNGDGNSAR